MSVKLGRLSLGFLNTYLAAVDVSTARYQSGFRLNTNVPKSVV